MDTVKSPSSSSKEENYFHKVGGPGTCAPYQNVIAVPIMQNKTAKAEVEAKEVHYVHREGGRGTWQPMHTRTDTFKAPDNKAKEVHYVHKTGGPGTCTPYQTVIAVPIMQNKTAKAEVDCPVTRVAPGGPESCHPKYRNQEVHIFGGPDTCDPNAKPAIEKVHILGGPGTCGPNEIATHVKLDASGKKATKVHYVHTVGGPDSCHPKYRNQETHSSVNEPNLPYANHPGYQETMSYSYTL